MQEILSFLDYLRFERVLSENTLLAYTSDLEKWELWLKENQCEWKSMDKKDVYTYLFDLSQKKELTKRSQARALSVLKSFYRFCEREGVIEENPLAHLRAPKFSKGLPKPIKAVELETFLETKLEQKEFLQKRDIALWELMYSAGMRISEVLGLNLKDIISVDISENEFDFKIPDSVKVVGKGSKSRVVFIGKEAKKALIEYIQIRVHNDNANSDALFLNAKGGGLTRRGANYILKKRLLALGLPADYSSHSLRHSFATDLLNSGANLRHIQELLGHVSISTTQNYTYVAKEKIRDTFWQSHPHAKRNEVVSG